MSEDIVRPVVTPMASPVRDRIRSAINIPSFPQILNELVQNALDAGATRIDCWISLEKGNERLRVEDDGHGIAASDLSRVGTRYMSSKDRTLEHLGPVNTYGFRGEALSSIAALGLLEVTTKTASARQTFTRVVKGSNVLLHGPSNRALTGISGTIVVVKDLFHKIPVRQVSLESTSSSSTIIACRRLVEAMALVRPGVKWTMWEEKATAGTPINGPKKIISINGCKTSAELYRQIYGNALVERVQNIRVSSGDRRIDGFISLHGSISKNNQHLYVNKFPLDKSEIHAAIAKRLTASRFSKMTQDEIETPDVNYGQKRSPRRLERYPIFVLNVTLPSGDMDVEYDPKKRHIGYRVTEEKDIDSIKALVLAVVDGFLRRHGFVTSKRQDHTDLNASPSRRRPNASCTEDRMVTTSPFLRNRTQPTQQEDGDIRTLRPGRRLERHPNRDAPPTIGAAGIMPPPSIVPRKRHVQDNTCTDSTSARLVTLKAGAHCLSTTSPARRLTVKSSGTRHQWIEDVVSSLNTGVMPFSPSLHPTPPIAQQMTLADPLNRPTHHYSHGLDTPLLSSTEINFTTQSLESARIVGQVDNKFIACLFDTGATGRTLVLIDQHAADERVAVEEILRGLCDGFVANSIRQTEVSDLMVVLTRVEARQLSQPGAIAVFGRWGISLESPEYRDEVDYVQIPVKAVPTVLASRLARKEASEITRLIRLYLDQLSEDLQEIRAAIFRFDQVQESEVGDWQIVQRWMPQEMLELVNSKACRNSIMFNDPLDMDQCKRLVYRLSKTRSPWICAHGRPSIVPIGHFGAEAIVEAGRKDIDWSTAAETILAV